MKWSTSQTAFTITKANTNHTRTDISAPACMATTGAMVQIIKATETANISTSSGQNVEHREQHQPHQVDHVPVGGAGFHAVHVVAVVVTFFHLYRENHQDDLAQYHVHEVEEGEEEIEHEEGVGTQVV